MPTPGGNVDLKIPAKSRQGRKLRTRITLHLQRDLGVNLAGAALALDLLERSDELDARLRVLSR